MADHQSLLRAAVERLPLSPPLDAGQLDEVVSVLSMSIYFARVNGLPRMQRCRQKDGMAKELSEFVKHGSRLCATINAMHAEAQGALSPKNNRHILSILDLLLERLEWASTAISNAPPTPANSSNHRVVPLQIAQVCAHFFRDLTGKEPTRHFDPIEDRRTGAFLHFVENIFEASGIKASAEHYAGLARDVGDTIGGGPGVTMRRIPREK